MSDSETADETKIKGTLYIKTLQASIVHVYVSCKLIVIESHTMFRVLSVEFDMKPGAFPSSQQIFSHSPILLRPGTPFSSSSLPSHRSRCHDARQRTSGPLLILITVKHCFECIDRASYFRSVRCSCLTGRTSSFHAHVAKFNSKKAKSDIYCSPHFFCKSSA